MAEKYDTVSATRISNIRLYRKLHHTNLVSAEIMCSVLGLTDRELSVAMENRCGVRPISELKPWHFRKSDIQDWIAAHPRYFHPRHYIMSTQRPAVEQSINF